MIEDDWADGLLKVEPVGKGRCTRWIFYSLYEDAQGQSYRKIVRKIVMPIDRKALGTILELLTNAPGHGEPERDKWREFKSARPIS
jgi:hypothetical protein